MAVFTTLKKEVTKNPATGDINKEIIMDPAAFGGANKLYARIT